MCKRENIFYLLKVLFEFVPLINLIIMSTSYTQFTIIYDIVC